MRWGKKPVSFAAALTMCAVPFAVIEADARPARAADDQPLRIALFQSDATPPLGAPLSCGNRQPARQIVDPLSARGIVLLGTGEPIVVAVVDWIGLYNAGHDEFREALAEAAGTTSERVTLHAIHNHDAPGVDFSAEELLAEVGLSGGMFDVESAREAIARAADALREAMRHPRTVTHLGLGVGIVERVASTRRVLGEDGRVKIVRMSHSGSNPTARDAPEGTIDPNVRLVSFWNGDQPLVAMTFYATHPQSYYGRGGVSADFVGMARQMREEALDGLPHVHFDGAGGDVAAGKYNDGSPATRPVLAKRLAAGMRAAWDDQQKRPIDAGDVEWDFKLVSLPTRSMHEESRRLAVLRNEDVAEPHRIRAARDIAYVRRVKAGRKLDVNCLRLGPARVLFTPGELFVKYQLAAQEIRPESFVAVAAYGDQGPGYIGTKAAYSQGGYETGIVSRTAPGVEEVLLHAFRELLEEPSEEGP